MLKYQWRIQRPDSLQTVSIRTPSIASHRTHRHFLAKILNRMEKKEKSVNASNPEHLFNNLVHEDKIA